ncbi:hypothetical protein CAPTEDRAFT_187663 [Capitella teleta]|uniref:Uncharacterized protein n=1 Tax=Capitella teleta TaxID=283909 RepID=R7UGZ1_CAPTE|nr:hypothetical protein CAPTEDRAFT_187663 [Capitella teleta]|eukprot:ELU02532.1 hypothetical protein CAPTEDRAFT_187663 [Capitella teleta]
MKTGDVFHGERYKQRNPSPSVATVQRREFRDLPAGKQELSALPKDTRFLLLYHSIWKSSIPLKIMDSSSKKALIRRVRERIWKDAGVEFDVHSLAQSTGGKGSGASINSG